MVNLNLDPNFKAKLKISKTSLTKFPRKKKTEVDSDGCKQFPFDKSAQDFQNMVRWCINGKVFQLNAYLLDFDECKNLMKHDYECTDEQTGYSIIEIASLSGHVEIMNLLLAILTDEDYFFKLGKCLDYAIANENSEMIECILIMSSPRDNSYPRYGNFIHFYGFSLNINCIKKSIIQVLCKYANKNIFYTDEKDIENRNPKTALQAAAELGKLELVKVFLENKVDPNAQYRKIIDDTTNKFFCYWEGCDNYRKTALHMAAENGHLEIVKELVKHNADIFALESTGKTPMELAKENSLPCVSDKIKEDLENVAIFLSIEMTKILQEIDVDYKAHLKDPKDRKYINYLHIEPRFEKLISESLNIALERSGKPNALSTAFKSLLFFVKLNSQDSATGFRAIDFAVYKGHIQIVKHLLQNGAKIEVDHDKENYYSALDIAISRNDDKMINCLLQYGLNSDIQRLHLAIEKGLVETAKKYIYEKNINKLGKNGLNALHLATIYGRSDLVEILLTKGADPNSKSTFRGLGRFALHFSAENCVEDIVEFLLIAGAKANQKDNFGMIPFDVLKKGEKLDFKRVRKTTLMDKLGIPTLDTSNETIDITEEKKVKVINSLIEAMGYIPSGWDIESTNKKKRKIDQVQEEERIDHDMAKPLLTTILNKKFPLEAKVKCIEAIEILMSQNLLDLKTLAKKDIIEEFAKVAEESQKNLCMIGRLLGKINQLNEGKQLISELRIPVGVYEKLKAEMNKTSEVEPNNFIFTSDSEDEGKHLKKKIKSEIIEIDSE